MLSVSLFCLGKAKKSNLEYRFLLDRHTLDNQLNRLKT
jgi:hypothetical protein